MSTVLVNILVGLATSVVSGAAVWTWQRGAAMRRLARTAAFFGVRSGGECLIVINSKYDRPGSTAHHDVHAMIEIATLVRELRAGVTVVTAEEFRGGNGDRTEFCVGGPQSNRRSAGHLAANVPGVAFVPPGAGPDAMAIAVAGRLFRLDKGRREYALVARFTPAGASRPVVLVCGQTSIANRAAVDFLKREHRALARTLGSTARFCLVIRADASETYGHQAAALDADLSGAAFRPAPGVPEPGAG